MSRLIIVVLVVSLAIVVAFIVRTFARQRKQPEKAETERVERQSVKTRPHLVPALVVAVMLLMAAAPLPYGYYQFLRWAVSGVAIFILVKSYTWKTGWATWLFGAVAVLFNPILPIDLTKEIWHWIDLAVALAFVSSTLLLHERVENGFPFWGKWLIGLTIVGSLLAVTGPNLISFLSKPDVEIQSVTLPSDAKVSSVDLVSVYFHTFRLVNNELVDISINWQGNSSITGNFDSGSITVPKISYVDVTKRYIYIKTGMERITYTIYYNGTQLDTWSGTHFIHY